MKIQIETELNDAMHILAAFSPDSKNKEGMQKKGKEALERMSAQVDRIVENIDNCGEATFH